ncbi:hypothetical protein [Pseudomonas kurunegalensis]|uniref:hypothetical protein n=1 Tax=Pseudomonas kurunegalensis TaxID=485880 RepID=UPI002570C6A0|nr:hypothetical protein [Pseudomonas kurunegalensis]WJD65445.1 hypothetical protein QQ992_02150 [Pseudomonas kurunegalensis]
MTHPAPCLTQLADDLENHGNLLALLTELPATKLSERGRIGLIQFSITLMEDFQRIETQFENYRASIAPSC